ncbi:MAG: endonuclease [Spirochaetia bacterium]|nr:endonuclease [Spirochaetia bacterium]
MKYAQKCLLVISALFFISQISVYSYDKNYYETIDSTSAKTFRKSLHKIIKNHKKYSYKEIWQILKDTDEDPNNKNNVILIYSGKSIPKDHNNGYNPNHKDYWNREHVWSKSHGFKNKKSSPAYTDAHHLRPADRTINSSRGEKDFDEGGKIHKEAAGTKSDKDSWEPRDEVKGDIARMMFYMDVRYEGENKEPDLILIDKIKTSGRYFGKLCTLYKWHFKDLPDNFEKLRNEKIYKWQGNRNPFVDNPNWVKILWGSTCE